MCYKVSMDILCIFLGYIKLNDYIKDLYGNKYDYSCYSSCYTFDYGEAFKFICNKKFCNRMLIDLYISR